MVSYPVQNLSDFLKNKPALVVFVLCLVALSVSTFYFAFEIEKDGPTEDSDKKHSWTSMRKHFNSLDTCINFSTWNDEISIKENEEQFKNELSVFTEVTIEDVSSLRPFSLVYGALSLQGWHSTTCQDEKLLPKNVEIFFDVPPQLQTLNGSWEVCVTVKGPAEFLPVLKDSGCEPLPLKKNKNAKVVKGFLVSKLPRIDVAKSCTEGKPVKLLFDIKPVDVENYLSDDVRTEIYIHLMWCSYFLVFVIFCMLMYAILKKSEYWEKKEQSIIQDKLLALTKTSKEATVQRRDVMY